MHQEHDKNPTVLIQITNKCNLQCPSCPVGRSNLKEFPKLECISLELCDKIFAKLAKKYGRTEILLYVWNEPLLHPDIVDILKLAEKYNHSCDLSSNLNVKADFKGILQSKALTTLIISISGYNQDIYSRGHKGGNVKTVLCNLENMKEAIQKTSADIVMSYHQYNDNMQDEIILKEKCKEYGIYFNAYPAKIIDNEQMSRIGDKHQVWQDEDDNIKLVIPRLVDKYSPCKPLTHLSEVPCLWQNNTIEINHLGEFQVCSRFGPSNEKILGDFLSLTWEDIKQKKSTCTDCAKCRKVGMHIYAQATCFFSRPDTKIDRSMLILIFDSKFGEQLTKKDIYIFGCSQAGIFKMNFLAYHGCNVKGYIDDDVQKNGKQINNIPIFSTAEIAQKLGDSIVIDAIISQPAAKRLEECGAPTTATILNFKSFINMTLKIK